jgi:hypothetical protein
LEGQADWKEEAQRLARPVLARRRLVLVRLRPVLARRRLALGLVLVLVRLRPVLALQLVLQLALVQLRPELALALQLARPVLVQLSLALQLVWAP